MQGWALHPLYAILHEAIYCQGQASLWAAQSVREVRCKLSRHTLLRASLAAQRACHCSCKSPGLPVLSMQRSQSSLLGGHL